MADLTTDENEISEDISEETQDLPIVERYEEKGPSNNTTEKQCMAPTYNKTPKRKAVDVVQKRMDEAYKILKTVANSEKPDSNQCSLYGQLVAQKLQALNELDRVVVMNNIDNLLFRATIKQMGRQSHTLHSALPQHFYNENLVRSCVSSPSDQSVLSPPQTLIIPEGPPSRPDSQLSLHCSSSQSYQSQSSPQTHFSNFIPTSQSS